MNANNSLRSLQHLGTIRSSNLCTEIIQYSSSTEIACCNLSSIALPKFVNDGTFDFKGLEQVTRFIVRALNNVIDLSPYPLDEMRRSNSRHRPMGKERTCVHVYAQWRKPES